ncbi:MAG: acetylxylan esterase [Planctomycetes bacterium]|nr:acetylxylan esterase [Planctomycetota bacterium]
MPRLALVLFIALSAAAPRGSILASERAAVSRVLPAGQTPDDARLTTVRTLRDAYHPWTPPATLEEWQRERARLREQALVSNGLWPLPPRTPLEAVIHGRIDRGDYTIEKVYFQSHPGHYVTGNLYRPKNIDGKAAGVLCPHGHWANGRFYDAGEQAARQQIEQGAEAHLSGARFPLQARMVGLARLGCVVFHYDMVGYADSKPIPHREGFKDAHAGLWLHNAMGLQTWNSIRALDFLLSLPDVDPNRIGVTGASGGGTQTFMLAAVDDRPHVAFPAVMVSTNMQGGCVCENADYLRQGINNIALAAVFAPKPLAMSGADDWTIDIETKGLPELKRVYSLYGKPEHVAARAWPEFKHNYNQRAREMMYGWFNEHLELGADGPIAEEDFEPVPPAELTVWDAQHPFPDDALSADQLRKYLTKLDEQQFSKLLPEDKDGLAEYREIVGTAARVMLGDGIPSADEVAAKPAGESDAAQSARLEKSLVGRKDRGEAFPLITLRPAKPVVGAVVWIDGRGKQTLFQEDGRPIAAVRKLLEAGYVVASADVLLTGEFLTSESAAPAQKVDETYPGYTFGYNRPLLANRVRDILTVAAQVRGKAQGKPLHFVGTGGAGAWVLLARAVSGDAVEQTLVDVAGFGFKNVESASDPMYLPGALKYGGLGGLAALAAPGRLVIAGTDGTPLSELGALQAAYRAAGAAERLSVETKPLAAETIADQLTN